MCRIVGYIGNGDASEILLSGLKRLEYRGYDSYGFCFINGSRSDLFKRVGRIELTESEFLANDFKGNQSSRALSASA